jgi:hypothetical protein
VLDGLSTISKGNPCARDVRHTFSSLVAAGSRSSGDQAPARTAGTCDRAANCTTAGGFLQPINSDSLKEAIGEAIAMDPSRRGRQAISIWKTVRFFWNRSVSTPVLTSINSYSCDLSCRHGCRAKSSAAQLPAPGCRKFSGQQGGLCLLVI